jgi:hypothetical protein
VTALHATSRWAISGTPIQNNLADFLGLFKFLRFAPYDDAKVFDEEISNLWRSKPAEDAAESFKRFLSCIMIRWTKKILELPDREDTIVRLPFNDQEHEYYRRIERPLAEMLDQAAREGDKFDASLMTTLQQINKLRLVCVLGIFVPTQQPCLFLKGGNDHLAMLAARHSLGGEVCMQCLLPIEYSANEESFPRNVYYSSCDLFFCGECSSLLQYRAPKPCRCRAQSSACPLSPLIFSLPSPSLTHSRDSPLPSVSADAAPQISSKVQALILQIKSYPEEKQ